MAGDEADSQSSSKTNRALPDALSPDALGTKGSPDPEIPRSQRMGDRHGRSSDTLDAPAAQSAVRRLLAREASVGAIAGVVGAVPLALALQSLNARIGLSPGDAVIQTAIAIAGIVAICLIRGDEA